MLGDGADSNIEGATGGAGAFTGLRLSAAFARSITAYAADSTDPALDENVPGDAAADSDGAAGGGGGRDGLPAADKALARSTRAPEVASALRARVVKSVASARALALPAGGVGGATAFRDAITGSYGDAGGVGTTGGGAGNSDALTGSYGEAGGGAGAGAGGSG